MNAHHDAAHDILDAASLILDATPLGEVDATLAVAHAQAHATLAVAEELHDLRETLARPVAEVTTDLAEAVVVPVVGDILTAVEELTSLPHGAVVIDQHGEPWRRAYRVGSPWEGRVSYRSHSDLSADAPVVAWLPKDA